MLVYTLVLFSNYKISTIPNALVIASPLYPTIRRIETCSRDRCLQYIEVELAPSLLVVSPLCRMQFIDY